MGSIAGDFGPDIYWGGETQKERFETILRHTRPGASILDLGTGRGSYVEELIRCGYICVGIDIRYYAEWSVKRSGLYVTATANALPFPDKAFHTTLAFEVLEHCFSPRIVLTEIIRCTSKRLILSVPNCDLNNALLRHDLVMAHWIDRTHCNFFTKDALSALLTSAGFRVVEVSDCYRVSPNSYFWNTLRIRPRRIAQIMKYLCERWNLCEAYWSSILVVADIPEKSGNGL